jgi:uncharacterized membrane protein YccC
MDLLKKIELLINAKTHAALPRQERHNPQTEEDAKILAEIRKALDDVDAVEQDLARRIKREHHQAQVAEQQGDFAQARDHKRRVKELDHYLNEQSEQAIKLEQYLAKLEDDLARAQEAVTREAEKVTRREAAADEVLSQSGTVPPSAESVPAPSSTAKPARESALKRKDDLETRKSRLQG